MLHDAVILAGCLDESAAFDDVVAARLLDEDVLARLAGPNGQQRVPMVRRHDGDGVERLVVEHAAEVLDALRRVAGQFLHGRAAGGEQAAVGIDQPGDLDVPHLAVGRDVLLPPAVDAGHGDAHPIVGSQARGPRPSCRRSRTWRRGRLRRHA